MRVPESRSVLGYVLRAPLRLVPPTTVVPVLGGPMRGMRWIVGSAPHGAWIGTLERAILKQFVGLLRPGMTVWDIGANVGLYSLPSARAVGPTGRVYAFEPMPQNARLLRRHLNLNRLANVQIWEVAVSDCEGFVSMTEGDSPSEFHVAPQGEWTVKAVTLDDWISRNGGSPPDLVKIDVEGSDDAVLRGGARVFAAHRPTMLLALHGERQRRECARLLTGWGYRFGSFRTERDLDASSEWFAEPA